jgi:mannose/fructose/N-acetylgalactosamine-specific phosphotransferase system component IIC
MVEPAVWMLLVLLGVATSLDTTSVGQVMISRPIVSGTIAGWILGDPSTGLLLGGVLEAAHLGGLPVGGARLPDPGPAAIPAVVAASGIGGPGGLAFGVGLGVIWGLLGGASIPVQRRLNGAIIRGVEEGRTSYRELAARHWACVCADGLRGGILTASGIWFAVWVTQSGWADRWSLGAFETTALLLLPGALAGGALLRAWSFPRKRAGLFFLAALGGLALAVLW